MACDLLCTSRIAFLPLAACLLLSGCDSGQKPTYPVKGKFVWEGGGNAKELAGGMVIFECASEDMSAKGSIDSEGGFVLGTYKVDDGAVAGKHKVAVTQPADTSAGDFRTLAVVDRKYESMDTTDLEVTIEPKPNEITLKVMPGAWMKRQKR
jgi:hypothetical protein